jgi:uncharacterized cupredoxin-like copper-binding protein
MRWLLATVAALLLGAATVGVGYAIDDSAGANTKPRDALGPGLVTEKIAIDYSKFSTDEVRVVTGTTVRFVIQNNDPINHEFIVGDASVHARHQRGTEQAHPPVPGEVSVGPNDDGLTIYRFDEPGRYEYACHLPGHLAFGMRGWVVVEPNVSVGEE